MRSLLARLEAFGRVRSIRTRETDNGDVYVAVTYLSTGHTPKKTLKAILTLPHVYWAHLVDDSPYVVIEILYRPPEVQGRLFP